MMFIIAITHYIEINSGPRSYNDPKKKKRPLHMYVHFLQTFAVCFCIQLFCIKKCDYLQLISFDRAIGTFTSRENFI